jgi:hypothetical protein
LASKTYRKENLEVKDSTDMDLPEFERVSVNGVIDQIKQDIDDEKMESRDRG